MQAVTDVLLPNLGDFKDVPVIEILVKPGDRVGIDDPLLTLESDKATMEVPAPAAGTVREIKVAVGARVSPGALLLTLDADEAGPAPKEPERPAPAATVGHTAAAAPAQPAPPSNGAALSHATPSLRRYARELGVDLTRIAGSGPKGRILKEDVQRFVQEAVAGASSAPATNGSLAGLLPWPQVDFAKFGPVERQKLSRIQKLSGANLHRNWVTIPHVTSFDEADVTELDAFRAALNAEAGATKITMLAFLVRAAASALKSFPQFNASLDGEDMVLKRYVHVGFAADTQGGLVVPVIRDADRKGVREIAAEAARLAAEAREGRLASADMQGGSFTISSLGGIGGTGFTPIINAPEVAILGVPRAAIKPVWDGAAFRPRLVQPLCLSFDHRAVDGAAAARFLAHLAGLLADFRRVLL
jgi:pyruvate dehydrogenase E2 component (dihydrolipoamide acetyltransferase)